MTDREFQLIVEGAIEDFWPAWKPASGKLAYMAKKLRFAPAKFIERKFEGYFSEHLDENQPKLIWGYVQGECEREGYIEYSGEPDEYGQTPHEKANVIRALREKRKKTGEPFTDEQVYLEWTRRVSPGRHGAPFASGMDAALSRMSLTDIFFLNHNGKLREYLKERAKRLRWWFSDPKIRIRSGVVWNLPDGRVKDSLKVLRTKRPPKKPRKKRAEVPKKADRDPVAAYKEDHEASFASLERNAKGSGGGPVSLASVVKRAEGFGENLRESGSL